MMRPSEPPGMETLLSEPPGNRDTSERPQLTEPWKRPNQFDLCRPGCEVRRRPAAGGLGPPGTGLARVVRDLPSGGQPHDELATRAGAVAEGRDAPPVQLDQGLHQGEPDAEPARPPAAGARALVERVEHPRQQVRGDPPAVIQDPHDDLP